jgi:hypothetical protein
LLNITLSKVQNVSGKQPYKKHTQYFAFDGVTPQITGGKKQSDEGAELFAVRVNLPCYACFIA